jgi:uncharacterized protein
MKQRHFSGVSGIFTSPLAGLTALILAGLPAMASGQTIGPAPESPGAAALERGDYNGARTLFSEACVSGKAAACARLGDLYRKGLGGAQDYDAADGAYTKACDGGDAYACNRLAHLVFQGQGLQQDYRRARSLYGKGCDLGDVSACAGLGNMMVAGFGGPKQRVEGGELLHRACRAELEYACNQIRRYGMRTNR